MVAGIQASTAARAADELETSGKKRITPYWRTLKSGGELNPKFPGGLESLAVRQKAEGHGIIQKGKRLFVKDFEKKLAKLK